MSVRQRDRRWSRPSPNQLVDGLERRRARRARGPTPAAAAPARSPRAARTSAPAAAATTSSARRRLASAAASLPSSSQQLAAHAVQLGEEPALDRPLGVREPFVDDRQPLGGAPVPEQRVGQQRQEHRPGQPGAERVQRVEAGPQLRGALGGAPLHRHRRGLEAAGPLGLLRELVLAAERDDLVAEHDRLGGLAAIEVHALRDDQREDERHRLALRSAERDRLGAARHRAIRIPERPQRARRHRARDHAGVDAEHRVVGLVLRRHVELARPLEQPARLGEIADELGGDAGDVVHGHQERRPPGLLGLAHQRRRLLAHERQIAADHVEEREVPQHREELGRIAELLAQGARARERRLELRRRPALDRSQREAADHLEAQLQLHALGPLGQRRPVRRGPARRARALRGSRTARRRAARRRRSTSRWRRNPAPSRTAPPGAARSTAPPGRNATPARRRSPCRASRAGSAAARRRARSDRARARTGT